jgi:hypothetical protein
MKPSESQHRLKKLLNEKGKSLEELKASDLVDTALEFYSSDRAKGCKIEEDGDMLMCQWGAHDWGSGVQFEFDLTRQFISKKWRGEELTQLHLTARYSITPELEESDAGDRWCHDPSEIGSFREFIQNSKVYSHVKNLKPTSVVIDYEKV